MSMTVLGPLPSTHDRLDVVSEWRIDEMIALLDDDEALKAALEQLDYARDVRAQIFVPPTLAVPATFTGEHRTYVCINQKGGAGKTTTAMELAAAFVAMGYTVRLIDADPQEASLSGVWLLPDFDGIREADRYTLTDVLFGRQPLDEATYETRVQGLYIVPSGAHLGTVEYDPKAGRDGSLRSAIRRSKAEVDITIIDAPPALGKLSINGLIAADFAIVPLKVGALDKRALRELHQTVRAVQEDVNPNLTVAATVMTSWDKSWYAAKTAAQLRADYPEAIVATARRSVKVAEAPDHGVPVRAFAPTANTTGDYDQLARLLLPVKEHTAA
ncbi:AAA family ATPase (plasmid) [Streptomyces olivoreticuli]|uniref:ParA family protein n=1 Tax=Streptomyces olivoreticuli TaxID=68246 RepID=UPI00265ACD76|nr:AAA family ATPase [Streptomyces olivoreticuli]WKK27821.1 AAA family ATPase [Streptomyces olivoreticuli]